jgi:DNA-binding IscR family transcriptional regulator
VIAAEPAAVLRSEVIADRIGAHPVVVRRLLGRLRSDGLVEGRSGPGGGWALARDPDEIGLGRVRRALGPLAAEAKADRLARTLAAADEAFARELDQVSIGDLARDPL